MPPLVQSLPKFLPSQLWRDPPPAYAFEITEAGIAWAKVGGGPEIEFQAFEEPMLTVSPVRDNIQRPEMLAAKIATLVPANGSRKRRAALILPDYSARVAVLDFDAFPQDQEEQRALVRFRMKKSVPFDADTAMVSYFAQPNAGKGKKIEVVVAVMAAEIATRYEQPFRAAGFVPGLVTVSSLAAANMIEPDEVTILVKLSGRTLSALVLSGSILKLVRCVEMLEVTQDEIESVIYPTLAYVEDELATRSKRILLCGLGMLGERLSHLWAANWDVAVEILRSRFGAPGPNNAGLLGYLESVAE
jgi:type IV pilus assembly protein PilM